MSILSEMTKEDRQILIEEMASFLSISVDYQSDFDYYENRVCGSIQVILYFENSEISRSNDTF